MDQAGTMRESVVRAIGWATATRFVAQLANWSMTLATIRFLRPQDYGLMAVTMTITGFISSISSGGIVDAVVQDRRATTADLRSVFGVVLSLNAGALLLLNALAYPAAWFYGEPRLAPLLQVSSLLFVGGALEAMPRAALVKKLDLKAVSRVELMARTSGGGLTLVLAWAGLGVWALLAGPLWAAATRAVGLSVAANYYPLPRFRFDNVHGIIRSGGVRTAENIVWQIYANFDVFIIGKLLGQDVLGIYYVARNLAALPVRQFSMTVKPAALPAFALVQDDRTEAFRYLRKAVRLIALTCFPVLFGLAATAPQVVALVLGHKWSAAATPVAILAIAMAPQMVGAVVQPFLAGVGEFAASFRVTLFGAILMPAAIAIGSRWGLAGVCAAWLISGPIQLAYLVRRVALVAQGRMGSLISPLIPPLAGSLTMYAVVRWLAAAAPVGAGMWTGLAGLVASGMLIYAAYALILMRPAILEVANLVKR